MENNEIMQRLLQDDKSSKAAAKEWAATAKANRDWDLPISRIRVVTAKYKVYIVLLLIFICALILIYIPKEQDSNKIIQGVYDGVKTQLDNVKRDIDDAKNDMTYLYDIVSNEQTLKNCLNSEDNCSALPEEWKTWEWEEASYDFSIPLSYLQLHSLYNEKMPVDEKRVLRNLNEYLIKQDILWGDKNRVWDILKIEIWDPKEVYDWNEHFFEAPVKVKIEFTTVEDLIWFLYNVEKKLIENSEDRILYKIQAVSYDVVSKDEPQVTDISMIAYYYHDEKFDGVDEYAEILGTNEDADNIEVEEQEWQEESDSSDNSGSILQGIFGK